LNKIKLKTDSVSAKKKALILKGFGLIEGGRGVRSREFKMISSLFEDHKVKIIPDK